MSVIWYRVFLSLFKPEDSPQLPDEESSYVIFSRSAKKIHFSMKALLWTAIAIIAGLIIGQMH